MIKLLPLPIIWMGFYILGRLLVYRSLVVRRYIIATFSILLLLTVCGPQTSIFYFAVSIVIILLAIFLSKIQNPRLHKITFIISLALVVLMIFVFLKWRIYFQKYFVYLPSLSYLGFRAIAYLTSTYKRQDIDLSAGLMQMFFFPMLFTGPISRVENFEELKQDYTEILQRLMLGLGMLIAGHFCGEYTVNLINYRTAADIHWSIFWLGALANSFELYFTFAGYTHLVIGLGLLVGFKLPENFNNPYLSTSISEFWRRWHMSMSYWIRDYLYIPLGGNRKGITRKCFNLMVGLGICGIWHGISLHYLLWGLYHGTLLCLESLFGHFDFSPLQRKCPPLIYKSIKVMSTFSLVSFGWLLFKYPIPEFVIYLKGMVSW